jgi:hypothetical protein
MEQEVLVFENWDSVDWAAEHEPSPGPTDLNRQLCYNPHVVRQTPVTERK